MASKSIDDYRKNLLASVNHDDPTGTRRGHIIHNDPRQAAKKQINLLRNYFGKEKNKKDALTDLMTMNFTEADEENVHSND